MFVNLSLTLQLQLAPAEVSSAATGYKFYRYFLGGCGRVQRADFGKPCNNKGNGCGEWLHMLGRARTLSGDTNNRSSGVCWMAILTVQTRLFPIANI